MEQAKEEHDGAVEAERGAKQRCVAAKAALPRWHNASLVEAATTYCVDAAAALDGVYRAREAALHARREVEAAATEAAAARTNGDPETGRGLAAEALARADAARAAALAWRARGREGCACQLAPSVRRGA